MTNRFHFAILKDLYMYVYTRKNVLIHIYIRTVHTYLYILLDLHLLKYTYIHTYIHTYIYIHNSGVVTILFTGIAARRYVNKNISDPLKIIASYLFQLLSYLAETSCFLLLGRSG